ncbi:MAG TPA: hypothetical protein VHB98_18325, partial [Chloroflexota bacterium]|nr:hypothetical protein [Chloroflexota bacterium]
MLMRRDNLPSIERASLHVYQLYDVSDSIDLERARSALASPSARMRPIVTRGGSITMPQLPLVVGMGQCSLSLAGQTVDAQITARIYDLGILALTIILPLPGPVGWEQAIDLAAEVQARPRELMDHFAQATETLCAALRPALVRPNETIRTEDYTLFLIEQLSAGAPASRLAHHPVLLQVALGERRVLSAAAASLATTLSYYEDDLIVLTWAAALVIEPDAPAREDAAFLLEFANAQLLAFRSYDDQVGRDLARIYPGLARMRRPRWWMLGATTRFLHEIHRLIADTTEISARVDNALQVTEDVYWNRVYTAALNVLRVQAWRSGITETLNVLRQTATLLNDEAEVARATVLEWLVIALIAVELIVALVALHR